MNYLSSKTKSNVNMTYAEFWEFDTSQVSGEGVDRQAALNEFKRMKIRMDKNLNNTRLAYKLSQDVYSQTLSPRVAR
jgi:hypothetical protein